MRLRPAAVLALAACALAACGPAATGDPTAPATAPSTSNTTAAPTEDEVLTIGVPVAQPGLGVVLGTGPSGFEPALAREIAARLGLEANLVPLDLDQRVSALTNGQVDMVLAGLSMGSSDEIDLAGPYLVVHQDLLTAPGTTEWRGSTLCGVQGTPGLARAQRLYAADTLIYPAETYGGCVEMLGNGTVAVVAGDDAVLAGFAARNPGRMSLAGAALAETRYRVGLPLGSETLCEELNAALAAIIEDGTWEELARTHLGPGYVPDPALNPPEQGACAAPDPALTP